MAVTYSPIATTTLGSAAASITFSSISQNYTDLVIVLAGNTDTGNMVGSVIRVGNGSVDGNSNYSMTELYADGSTAASYRESNKTNWNIILTTSGTSTTMSILHLMNYSNTTTYKTVLSRGNTPTVALRQAVGLWRSTSAINIITIAPGAYNWAAGTTATLYGILAA